jgi:hypothetical protein
LIEEQGIPTACISLIRPHSERVEPPRSLWVPFELGRPLGVPNDADFQKKVLLTLLRLLERSDGPVILEDYPIDAPETAEESPILSCPVRFDNPIPDDSDPLKSEFLREIQSMHAWYETAQKKRDRTTLGGSGVDVDLLGEFIYSFIEGKEPENPLQNVDLSVTLKMAVEDLKGYYVESVTAQPGQENLSSKALKDWFWNDTSAGKVLLKLIETCSTSGNEKLKMTGSYLIAPMDIMMKHKLIEMKP